jgi:hypothetical protein
MIPRYVKRLVRRLATGWLLAAPRWFSISIEIFLRHNFGQRYLTWVALITSFFGVVMTLWVIDVFLAQAKTTSLQYTARSDLVQELWLLFFWIAGIWHKATMLYHSFRGQQLYSFSPGESMPVWRFIPISEVVIFRFIEPLMVLLAGYFMFALTIDGMIATWLFISGTCLFFKRQGQYYSEKNLIFDMIDSRARSERIRAALDTGEQPRKNSDFTVTPIATYYQPEIPAGPDPRPPDSGKGPAKPSDDEQGKE